MGPAMNIVLAVVVLAVVLMQGADGAGVSSAGPPASASSSRSPPPSKPACAPATIVTRLGRRDVATWEQLDMAVASRPERDVEMVVIRDRREERLTIRPDLTELRTRGNARFEIGTIGVLPDANPHIRALVAGEPAEKAGVKAGDVIVSINGERMVFASQVSEAISRHPEQEIQLVVRRDDVEQTITVTPSRQGENGRIGINISDEVESFKPGPLRGRRHERPAQRRDVGTDSADAGRPVQRRDVARGS